MHLGQATFAQAEATMLVAARLIAPRCTSLLHRLDAEQSQPLTLGIPDVDRALGGGLLTASITELVGAAGSAHPSTYGVKHSSSSHDQKLRRVCCEGIGKSQMCMTLAARACLPSGCGSTVTGNCIIWFSLTLKKCALWVS